MSATENALSELRKQIETNKALLAEQERALEVLEKMMGYSNKPDSSLILPLSNVPSQRVVIAVDELGNDVDRNKQTLRAQVLNVIECLGDQEFSASHILVALKKMGIIVNGLHPRSRISTILYKLEESGVLVKTFAGAGNVPHKYKMVPAETRGLI